MKIYNKINKDGSITIWNNNQERATFDYMHTVAQAIRLFIEYHCKGKV